MNEFSIDAGSVTLRTWRTSDQDDLVAEANSRAVWRNLLHLFPHPYTQTDAQEWIERCLGQEPAEDLVIACEDKLVGVMGFDRGSGVSHHTASVGYWLGEQHWNQGFVSAAFAVFLEYVWETFDVERIQAEVFSWNPASSRVLQKSGFVCEGTRRRAIFKDGDFVDEHFYSLLRSEQQ